MADADPPRSPEGTDDADAAPKRWQPRGSPQGWATDDVPPTIGQVAQLAAVVALVVGLATGAFILALGSIDCFGWKDVPIEQALVIAQVRSHTVRVACGRALWANTDAQITTFVVQDPREGLPATFTVTGCGVDSVVGDVTPVMRVGSGTEDDVMIGPKLTAGSLAQLAGVFAAAAFAIMFTWRMVTGVLGPRWQRWVAARRIDESLT